MEKEVIIIALIYIEKVIEASQMNLLPENWRKIMFTALIIASKVHTLTFY